MNRKVLFAGLAVTLPIVVILAANLGREPHRVRSPLVGKPAPTFSLREAGSDRTFSLESLRGRTVVLNFWATWCVPCYAEHEALTSSAHAYGNSVQFLGVVYQDTEEKALQFLRENGSAYPSLLDDAGKTAIAYGVYGVPETFFIRPDGSIAEKFEGPLSAEAINQELARAMR